MNSSRIVVVPFAAALVLFGFGAARGVAQEHHLVVPAEKVQWAPAPPFLPPGAQITVVEGNPAEKGPVTLRLKFPAGYVIAPHWHTMAERITVLSGTFNVGAGDALDRSGSQALNAGGFVMLPSKMHHYAWVKTPTVVQVSLDGPFDIFYINPSDDPQKSAPAATSKR